MKTPISSDHREALAAVAQLRFVTQVEWDTPIHSIRSRFPALFRKMASLFPEDTAALVEETCFRLRRRSPLVLNAQRAAHKARLLRDVGITEMRRAYLEGFSLRSSALRSTHPVIHRALNIYAGSWDIVMKLCGIHPTLAYLHQRTIARDILDHMIMSVRQMDHSAETLLNDEAHWGTRSASSVWFGGIANAYKLAWLEDAKLSNQVTLLSTRKAAFMQYLSTLEKHAPLQDVVVMSLHYTWVITMGTTLFGSWSESLKAFESEKHTRFQKKRDKGEYSHNGPVTIRSWALQMEPEQRERVLQESMERSVKRTVK